MGFIIFCICVLPFVLVAMAFIFSRKNDKVMDELIVKTGYTPDYQYPFIGGRLCVCQSERKIMLVYLSRTDILSYEDILSVEMFIDGKSTFSRSTGKVLGASLIGGVIGAMCVDQNEKKTYSDLHVNIGTRNIGNPTITLPFVILEIDDISQPRKQAMDIVNTLKAIIDENDRCYKAELAAAQVSAVAQSIQSANETSMSLKLSSIAAEETKPAQNIIENHESSGSMSIANEIRAFAKLFEDGIISEAEFNDYKSKLLNGGK